MVVGSVGPPASTFPPLEGARVAILLLDVPMGHPLHEYSGIA